MKDNIKISDHNFFFVVSQLRMRDGTPLSRERFATHAEAEKTAITWAAKSEHGGKYIVLHCVAVGEAQRKSPPVEYTDLTTGEVTT